MHSSSASILTRARELVGGQRALVIGLAREGLDLTRFLTSHGASVVVTDRKGHRVQGLKAADFRLRVDGRQVHLDYFTEVQEGQAATPAAEATVTLEQRIIVPTTTRLLTIGANIGAAKRRCALRSPVATAPSP